MPAPDLYRNPIENLGAALITAQAITRRIAELANMIDASYAAITTVEHPLVLICVLKGSLFFTADLARALSQPVEIDCVAVRSYGVGTTSSGSVELVKDVGMSLQGRHVLMVEDIIDTGRTTAFLYEHIERHSPASLRLVSLLTKTERRERQVRIDFVGFDVPDRFVVGYGLDHAERYRNLPDIRLLNQPTSDNETIGGNEAARGNAATRDG